MGYVNNYDKNRYLEKFSKAAVDGKSVNGDKIDLVFGSTEALYIPEADHRLCLHYYAVQTLFRYG